MSENKILEIRHLSKDFGSHKVLRDIDFLVHPGDVTSIIGASGSGKSTLLRCINLLETPTSGEILFHGENIMACRGGAPAYRAKVGMVFQSFNLFDNMSVLRNCMVGQTKVLKKSKAEAEENAMRYSFLMSIPAVLGANILNLKDIVDTGVDMTLLPAYISGVVTAAVLGYLSIRLLKFVTEKGKFGAFSYYCWAVGALTIIASILL